MQPRLPSTGGTNTVEESVDEIIDPVFKELRERRSGSDRTIIIIYMPLKWCGYAHHRACTEYGQEDVLMCVPVALDHAYSAASAPSAGGDVAQELSQMSLDDSTPGAGVTISQNINEIDALINYSR